jgi:MFS family permease
MSSPGQTIGISVFTDFLIDELRISRESLSLAYLIGTLISSFLLTYAGKFFDKFGARITSVLAGFFLGLSLLFISEVGSVGIFITSTLGVGNWAVVIFILLILAFFFVRFFGQGVLTMSSKNMVMMWFEKRRGMASAFMGIAISFGFSYSPVIFDWLILFDNWQTAWQTIALVVGIFFVLFAISTFRDSPEKYGLKPDGMVKIEHKRNTPKYHSDKDYTLKEARKTYSFWIFNLTLSLQGLYVTALTFNIVDIFNNAGLNREEAIHIFLPSAIIAVTFQIVSGYLADIIKLKYLLLLQLVGIIISTTGLIILSSGIPMYLVIAGNGIASGLFGVISTVTFPRFFGTKHLGSITGYNMSWIVAGSAIGPYLFSLLYDFSGNYETAGIVCLTIAVILFILAFKAENVNQ